MTSPLVVRIAAWVGISALLAVGAVRYDDFEAWSPATRYLLLANGAFALGYVVARGRLGRRNAPTGDELSQLWDAEARRYSGIVTVLSLAGIVAAVLFSIEMLMMHSIDPGDFVDTRAIFVGAKAGPLTRIAAVLGAGGFVGLVAAILFWERLPPWRRLVCLAAPCSLTVFSLFSGGRQMMLQLILVAYFASSVRSRFVTRRPLSGKSRVVLIAVLAGGVAYGMLVATQRGESATRLERMDQLERMFQMRLDRSLADRLSDTPAFIKDGVAEGLVYVTHGVPNFAVFWDQQWPGPYLGLWEFPFVARRFSGIGVVEKSVDERIEEVYEAFREKGRFPQVWQTSVRDLILDFGDVGALVVLAFAGAFSSLVYRRMLRRVELAQALLVVWVDLACVYSVLLSAVSDTFVFFFLIIGVALALPRWWLGSRSETAPA